MLPWVFDQSHPAAAEVVTGLNARGEDIGTSGQVFAGISMIPGTGLAKRAAEGLAAIGKGGFKLAKGAFEYGAGYFRKVDDIADAGKNAAKHIDMPATVVVPRVADVAVSELNPTHRIKVRYGKAQAEYEALKADIKANGITQPIKYVESNGTKYVVDGHHRLRAALELGLKKIPGEKVELPFGGYNSVDDLYNYFNN